MKRLREWWFRRQLVRWLWGAERRIFGNRRDPVEMLKYSRRFVQWMNRQPDDLAVVAGRFSAVVTQLRAGIVNACGGDFLAEQMEYDLRHQLLKEEG